MLGLPTTFWFLWTGVLINRLGSFVLVFLTLYLTAERGFSTTHAGAVVALYGLGATASGPAAGAIADRLGRRVTLLTATVLGSAAMLQVGFARSPEHIAISTLMLGFFGESYRPAANAAVVDLVPEADRVRAFGALYWAANLGFAAATILGGVLAQQGYVWLFVLDAATTLGFGVVVLFAVPESRPGSPASPRSPGSPASPGSTGPEAEAPTPGGGLDLLAPYRDRRLLRFLLAQLLTALVFHQCNSTLALDIRQQGYGAWYGYLLSINGVLIVLLQPLSVSRLAGAPRHLVLAGGTFLVGLGFGATALGHSVAWHAVSITVWTLGEIVFTPITPAVIGDLAPRELRASYQGALHLSFSIAAMAGPLLGTAVLEWAGSRALWLGCLGLGSVAALIHLTGGQLGRQAGTSPTTR